MFRTRNFKNLLLKQRKPLSTVASPPDAARVVIVGGGIIGSSIAYHLGKLGIRDVVVLEQSKVTSGTTWYVKSFF